MMELDKQRILSKAAYIKEQVTSIRKLTSSRSREEIINDPWTLMGVKYSLQTAIEALIDIVYHISAKRYAHAPVDARDALRVLTDNGVYKREEFAFFPIHWEVRRGLVTEAERLDNRQTLAL